MTITMGELEKIKEPIKGIESLNSIDDIIKALEDVGNSYAQAQATLEFYEHQRHVVISELMNAIELEMLAQGGKPSESKLERKARADREYKNWIKELSEIKEQALLYRSKWEILMTKKESLARRDNLEIAKIKANILN